MPNFAMPALATDCHHHIYDARFPSAPDAPFAPPDASVADYQAVQAQLGLARNVIVQPSTYGFDNRLLLRALSEFGPSARGVAVVPLDIADEELDRLHAAGVRGARVNLLLGSGTTAEQIKPLARRIGPRGWHVQLVANGKQIAAQRNVLTSLEAPLVVDHMGLLPLPFPMEHPGFAVIADLLSTGRGWVKLSGVCNLSEVGPPYYSDYSEVARALVAAFPHGLLWGSDWPHVAGRFTHKPDDAQLLALLAQWCPEERLRERVLVDHPAQVYGF
ncbi:amidohydrolase family protein [Acidovorax sp. NCPPB 4044]|uniref:amidohydrolase family protein n=1 Tax=Acidovorax sp. NCPPB 4044 TaxID=2940490 RepID=UPI002302928C|nr:amidohydrolase family protein [Acidovorax sp. NCPPB 4044]MDA8520166.1 amidohydrolase family protein [Acidovorax sp. NCPPB 4044]